MLFILVTKSSILVHSSMSYFKRRRLRYSKMRMKMDQSKVQFPFLSTFFPNPFFCCQPLPINPPYRRSFHNSRPHPHSLQFHCHFSQSICRSSPISRCHRSFHHSHFPPIQPPTIFNFPFSSSFHFLPHPVTNISIQHFHFFHSPQDIHLGGKVA
jgi:hypothetical protein